METQKQLLNKLLSTNYSERYQAIKQLPSLESHEALTIIETIKALEGNLMLKVEAIRVLPEIISETIMDKVEDILKWALKETDTEIVRSGLFAIRRFPKTQLPINLIDLIGDLLKSSDTDIQYQAVISMTHFRDLIPPEQFTALIQPLTQHPNKALKEAALLSIEGGSYQL